MSVRSRQLFIFIPVWLETFTSFRFRSRLPKIQMRVDFYITSCIEAYIVYSS